MNPKALGRVARMEKNEEDHNNTVGHAPKACKSLHIGCP